MAADFKVLPLTPALGAELVGIDIDSMDQDQFEALYQHWLKYRVSRPHNHVLH